MPNHDVGGADYYFRAVTIMMERLKSLAKDSCTLYVVCSDDQHWAKANIRPVVEKAWAAFNQTKACAPKVVHSPGRSASEDMAMLASCNHTIMNIGTYGWWGSWLAGGITIVNKIYPPFTPKLSASIEDYYPPKWILIT
jgi:galactoside 2-L-fucosyltransferase 1/2